MSRSAEIKFYAPNLAFLAGDDNADEDLVYEAEVDIYSLGCGATYWDPAEAPEFEISKIIDESGNEIPPWLPPRLRDRFEAWFNSRPIRRRENPEWDKLETLARKAMEEDFDWDDYIQGEAEAAWEARYSY